MYSCHGFSFFSLSVFLSFFSMFAGMSSSVCAWSWGEVGASRMKWSCCYVSCWVPLLPIGERKRLTLTLCSAQESNAMLQLCAFCNHIDVLTVSPILAPTSHRFEFFVDDVVDGIPLRCSTVRTRLIVTREAPNNQTKNKIIALVVSKIFPSTFHSFSLPFTLVTLLFLERKKRCRDILYNFFFRHHRREILCVVAR